jgi:hypothetical protein
VAIERERERERREFAVRRRRRGENEIIPNETARMKMKGPPCWQAAFCQRFNENKCNMYYPSGTFE